MSQNAPTVVLVHGAFAESASWNAVVERLHARSVDVIAVANPLRSVSGDAAYLRDVLAGIAGPIVLVGHSYGGLVITEAASGNHAVVALVYVGAFCPESGESAIALSGMFPGSTLADALVGYPVSTGGNELRIAEDAFPAQFAGDVPVARAVVMAVTQRPVTEAALTEGLPSAEAAWHRLPSWFVYGDADENIPAELQRFMVDRAGAKGVREVAGASHALAVSQPEAVTATILEALEAATP
ncbi:alpha/beta fold hydrolase [Blastococcus haudaquaticus]|uniref:Pimeloyl-ACP methyl ester carboxylesterase n=1 Tax=Blastococcus haudaquaticus TaxID=1938745 RepID=A0A286GUA6_9ACTN|nr:alpha/beta hydrolase [Blastococcus haudaquaticus]SOD98766.1 Pimeloyl-ACP methyl ester carboxylesterase [Blastococcus haudaquaticus]